MNSVTDRLHTLQRCLSGHYCDYKNGKISQQEYLLKIKPIDEQIGKIELSSLKYFTSDVEIIPQPLDKTL